MAVTASFGLPPARQAQQAAMRSAFPQVLVLVISKSQGGFQRELPVASAMKREELDRYLGEWLKLAENRNGYVSSKIVPTSFVTPTNE